MNGKGLALGAGYVAVWTALWWFATEPGRDSAAIIARIERAAPGEAAPMIRELTVVYTGSPRQANADYAENPKVRSLIASAAAPVPGCLLLVEEALETLDETSRINVMLSLAVNGPPSLDAQGHWAGKDAFHPRPDAVPLLRRRLEAETSRSVAVLAALALRAAGDLPTPDEVFARASSKTRPLASRSAELIVLADQPGGTTEIMRALRDSLIPDDAAASIATSGTLDRDPAWKTFALSWAIDRRHASAAGGAFPMLYDAFPDDSDRIWSSVSAAERGKRVPLMLALMTRNKWPAGYRAWWMGTYDKEKEVVAGFEEQLAQGDLQNFGRWATDEREPGPARALRAVQEHLHEIAKQAGSR
ncbi:MAG: hypothetical protein K8T20_04340 [Planctomycetes bacterium]|nr:hypothetical protein [Planctomycetota bacterium]